MTPTTGRLADKVLQFEHTIRQTVARAKEPGFGAADWDALAELVAVDDFERVGNWMEVMNWAEYTGFLTRWAAASVFSTERRRITEAGNLVFLELQETNTHRDHTTVVNSMSVYEFDASQRIRHLDIYLQHERSMG